MIERGRERAMRRFRDGGDALRRFLERIVVVDDEVVGLDRVMHAQRITRVRDTARGNGDRSDGKQSRRELHL
jgi:hypothetical protein